MENLHRDTEFEGDADKDGKSVVRITRVGASALDAVVAAAGA